MAKPTVLIIRDGWGENHNPAHDKFNAVKLANIPVSRKLSAEWPRTEIAAHGPDVGLPDGVMGNSEVGHQNIGAGRIVDQEILRLNKGLADPAFAQNADFRGAVEFVKKHGGKLHLFGLASAAGVHSELSHLYALLRFAKDALPAGTPILVHAFMDGRDSPPTSGLGFIRQIEQKLAEIGAGKIASVAGRFWAMDRDNRFSRVQKAYDALTGGDALTAPSAETAVQNYYDKPLSDSQKGDEFVLPTRIVTGAGADAKPVGVIADGDAVIFFNFRGDRPREITRCFIFDDARLGELVEKDKNGAVVHAFARPKKLDIFYATLTDYQKGLCPNILFRKPPKMVNILGEWVSKKGLHQFRTAETEKYPHVTFFFNDYRDEPFTGEDRECPPSPKDVATYDLKPEMNAAGVTKFAKEAILEEVNEGDDTPAKTIAAKHAILSGKYSLIVINYANPDMVGHTGSLPAAIKACEAVDRALAELLPAIDKMGGNALICADHGNVDQMWEPETNSPHTRHTLNPVEVVIYGHDAAGNSLQTKKMSPLHTGRLADIAPTLLDLMGLDKPAEMTGKSL
ncbi:MAG: 2,3-bisphosphoglycerate-independent phosphoglycerate mutase, partial [Puniceicoccales bacterium]|nr:2,3-bisphosphoglycerate-independent phosphoglycerate mutase [Puniceicoccales bacterium]